MHCALQSAITRTLDSLQGLEVYGCDSLRIVQNLLPWHLPD
jgi:hypothetical protein